MRTRRRSSTAPRRSAACAALLAAVLASGAASAQPAWREILPAGGISPPGRTNAAAIHDPVARALVVFGGNGATGARNDVWALSLDTDAWTELTPASGPAPAPRFTPNAIYDPVRHVMIVWAGQGTGFFNDVWEFDLAAPAWRELVPAAPRPNVRYGTAAVFDPVARELVTFAGFTDQGRFDDTWRFDVDLVSWRDVSKPARPGRRCLHTAAYDSLERRMIVFGGQRTGALDDVWALDLATDGWTEIVPPIPPAPRWFAASAYEPRFHAVLVFGGGAPGTLFDETLALDLVADRWSVLAVVGPKPSPREGAVAILVPGEDRLLVFGGAGPGGFRSDAWSLDSLADAFVPGCLRGGVGAGAGAAAEVLRVDGGTGGPERLVVAAVGAPVELALDASPAGPSPAEYALWIWSGHSIAPSPLATPAGRPLGCVVRPLSIAGPPPLRALVSAGLPPAASGGARVLPSPRSAPFAETLAGGAPRPLRATIQGVLEDAGSAHGRRFSPTNAIFFEAR
jgi:hypothetical protein